MTDKELLELAAKAAGLTQHRWCDAWNGMAAYTLQDGYYGPTWNPLQDDGDALRLAVKLGFEVECGNPIEVENVYVVFNSRQVWEEIGDDHLAAVRRCIVRAAANIGEKL